MASTAGVGKIGGRVDLAGRLVQADSMLAELQADAGSAVGQRLALPQLAAVARLARKLGVGIARPVIVAARDHDLELWVRAEPEGGDVLITVESWHRRPPSGPRLEVATRSDHLLPIIEREWATDAELRISLLSPDLSALLGAQVGEAIGQPLTKWLRLVEADDGALPMLSALAARVAFCDQLADSRKHPERRLILSGEPIAGPDGMFDGFRGRAVPTDAGAPALNGSDAARMGIDPALDLALRSPLARIIEAAETIADRTDGPLRSDYAAYADDIGAAAHHLLSVIRAMVDQPDGGKSSVDVSLLIDEAIALVRSKADVRNLIIEREGPAWAAAIGDARAIVQILVNLLGNAVRHSPPGGRVAIILSLGDADASITIADQGSGIDPVDQERIFGKFERVGEEGGDAGLGLAIARRLANSMAGDISLVSAPGKGARFTLRLPLA